MNYLKLLILSVILFHINNYSQSIPFDFKITGTTSELNPGSVSESITIIFDGQTEFVKIQSYPHQILVDTLFSMDTSEVEQIWQVLQDNDFFSLNDIYKDDSLQDGLKAVLTVTANGTTKRVIIKNTNQQEILNIINSINSNVPSDFNLNYKPPEKFNIVPDDPCDQSFGFKESLLRNTLPKENIDKIKSNYKDVSSIKVVVKVPHGGVEIGYEMTLIDAITTGRATLKSKGTFFGDGVSITGDNTKNFPPPDNIISIKLNLEFFGPCDNDANEFKIVKDIYQKWNGLTTSSGKKIEMDVRVISHPGLVSPPGTPGFDEIKLECGQGRSFCNSMGSPNSDGTTGGTWYPSDGAGTFGHEAGHLMGLVDQYDDWDKQPDGSWVNANDGTALSKTDFVDKYNAFYGTHLNLSDFDKDTEISMPRVGHDNDIMGNEAKPPLKSDIDDFEAGASLIIDTFAGDILTDPNNEGQNLMITHSNDLVLKPGEIKTLNGLYTACIDHYKLPPDSNIVLNIVPPLAGWNGIPAAQYLLKLAKYMDSLNYYCGNYSQFDAQEAVWRITDNSVPSTTLVDSLLKDAGINLGIQTLYFPKLSNKQNTDTISKAYIPSELFTPEIQPKSIQAGIGEDLAFNAIISKPNGYNYSTNFSWFMETPEGSLSLISSNGTFVPDKKGVYSVSLKINIVDSLNSITEYIPDLKGYAVVPDKYTETFEHEKLTDIFKWETYGDSKWEITNSDAETGFNSIRSGTVTGNQSTTLAINVKLLQDSTIAFFAKLFTSYVFSKLEFDIDSINVFTWYSSADWQLYKYKLSAGSHRLTWKLSNTVDMPSIVWLDNIFFPANSVATTINSKQQIPISFNLFQNYPNPFNSITVINFSLAEKSGVRIVIYNVLGEKIKDLFLGEKDAGIHEIKFDATELSSGVYFYSIEASNRRGNYSKTRKMILLK